MSFLFWGSLKKSFSFFLYFFVSLLFCFTSCKVASKTELSYTNVETIKNEIAEIDKTLSWNKEIEPQRLVSNADWFNESITFQIEKNVELLKIINSNSSVYPEFEDFGSLNDSLVNADLYKKIEQIFVSVSNNIYNGPETYFDSNYLYNYVFFREDLKEGWKKNFHKDFPHIVDYKDSEDSKKENTGKATQSSEENNSVENKSEEQTKQPEEKKTVIQKEKLFSKWIIGEPFFSEEIVQIPVRLYCKYGTIDVTLYLNRQNSNAVNLITIDRWKKI